MPQTPPEDAEDDPALRDMLERIEALCHHQGYAYVASVARLTDKAQISVLCRGGTPGTDRLNAQMLMVCCEALTELRGLSMEELRALGAEAEEEVEPDPWGYN